MSIHALTIVISTDKNTSIKVTVNCRKYKDLNRDRTDKNASGDRGIGT